MVCSRLVALVVVAAGCAGSRAAAPTLPLRPACADGQRWDGATCAARTAAAALAAGEAATRAPDMDAALAALDRAATEPLDLASHVRLWEGRGLVRAYLAAAESTPASEDAARAAFDRLLAIAPQHRLACDQSPQATLRFEQVRAAVATRAPRELEITWPRDRRVGEPIAVDLETVADPAGVLAAATLYIRRRGATAWRAADLVLPPVGERRRVLLPAEGGTASTGLEIYAVAHDAHGNETLAWASPSRPRDIPLRYDPPTPWYRTWWVWAIAGGVVATGAGITAYAVAWEPSARLDGTVER